MRHLVSLFLIVFLSLSVNGQGKWYIASDVGLNTSRFDLYVPTSDPTIMIDVRAWRMLNKHWQLGLSVEFGKIQTLTHHVESIYNNQGSLLSTRNTAWNWDVLSPYFAPTAFAHYQLNFAPRGYLYAGPAVGIINGIADFQTQKYITSYLIGANIGVVIPFSKHVQLTVSNAWRTTYAKLQDASHRSYAIDQQGGYAEWYIRDSYIHFFNLKGGLIVAL